MKTENFGTIINNGGIVDLDKTKIEDLEKLSKEYKEKEEKLKSKIVTVFKQ